MTGHGRFSWTPSRRYVRVASTRRLRSSPGAEARLGEDVADVPVHGGLGDDEVRSDAGVGAALGDQTQDFAFSVRQGRERGAALQELVDHLQVHDRLSRLTRWRTAMNFCPSLPTQDCITNAFGTLPSPTQAKPSSQIGWRPTPASRTYSTTNHGSSKTPSSARSHHPPPPRRSTSPPEGIRASDRPAWRRNTVRGQHRARFRSVAFRCETNAVVQVDMARPEHVHGIDLTAFTSLQHSARRCLLIAGVVAPGRLTSVQRRSASSPVRGDPIWR